MYLLNEKIEDFKWSLWIQYGDRIGGRPGARKATGSCCGNPGKGIIVTCTTDSRNF